MKLNLEYYKEELDNKIVPEEFEKVQEIINSDCENYADSLGIELNINTILALSEIRNNLFKNRSSISKYTSPYRHIHFDIETY